MYLLRFLSRFALLNVVTLSVTYLTQLLSLSNPVANIHKHAKIWIIKLIEIRKMKILYMFALTFKTLIAKVWILELSFISLAILNILISLGSLDKRLNAANFDKVEN